MNETTAQQEVKFFWRPGCPFCMKLELSLKRLGVDYNKYNIWEDPEAAATVRSAAGGNETVPTVIVGDTALVNPSGQEVKALL